MFCLVISFQEDNVVTIRLFSILIKIAKLLALFVYASPIYSQHNLFTHSTVRNFYSYFRYSDVTTWFEASNYPISSKTKISIGLVSEEKLQKSS